MERGDDVRAAARRRGGGVRRPVPRGRPALSRGPSGRRRQASRAFRCGTRHDGARARFIAAGFEAILVCVDPPSSIAPCRAGFDDRLLADLPAGVDPCGENGEFHTFVDAGPIMPAPIAVEVGETVERDGFVFTDLSGDLRARGSGAGDLRTAPSSRAGLDPCDARGHDPRRRAALLRLRTSRPRVRLPRAAPRTGGHATAGRARVRSERIAFTWVNGRQRPPVDAGPP